MIGVVYLSVPLESTDQAVSLAAYLTSHGVAAVREGSDAVSCPVPDPATDVLVKHLLTTWPHFWEHNDEPMMAAPVYVKPGHDDCEAYPDRPVGLR